jgi:hypothetical protein
LPVNSSFQLNSLTGTWSFNWSISKWLRSLSSNLHVKIYIYFSSS